jgi:hypothetical protein
MGWWASGLWCDSLHEILLLSTESRPIMGPGGGHEDDQLPSTTEVKNVESCTSTSPYIYIKMILNKAQGQFYIHVLTDSINSLDYKMLNVFASAPSANVWCSDNSRVRIVRARGNHKACRWTNLILQVDWKLRFTTYSNNVRKSVNMLIVFVVVLHCCKHCRLYGTEWWYDYWIMCWTGFRMKK